MAKDLVTATIEGILDATIDGTFEPGVALPKEIELAAMFSVSRLTVREAVRILADRRVLNVIHGRGTYLVPCEEWIDLGSLAYVHRASAGGKDLGMALIEIRAILEVGAARLAAIHHTDEDLKVMKEEITKFLDADLRGDSRASVDADVAFHSAIFAATKNMFMAAIVTPLEEALYEARLEVAKDVTVRRRSCRHHEAIYSAIASGDPERAMSAMRAHLEQTKSDLEANDDLD